MFYIIVGALLVIVGLSMFVLVAWRKVDGDHGCMLCRLLFSVVERYFHRKADTSRRHIQPTPAAEERSRLRSAQRPDVEPAVMGSVRLTVPTVPDLPPSTVPPSTTTTSDGGSVRLTVPTVPDLPPSTVPPSTTTTSDGGSSEQPAAESGKTTSTDFD